jgi:hypothetical protein
MTEPSALSTDVRYLFGTFLQFSAIIELCTDTMSSENG